MELDSLNQHILALLKEDARQSATEIGRTVGLSRTAVQDRIRKLEQKGVIRGYRVIVGEAAQETFGAVIFVKISRRPCEVVLNWLSRLNGVHEVISLSGEWDAIVRFSAGSTEALSELNDNIAAHDLVEKSTSQIILKTI